MGRPEVQVSQQVANLQAKLTYTNNTSDAQIQISPLGYNLGQRAQRGWEKRRGGSGCRDERGRRGKGSYISTHTFVGVRSEHVYGGGRGDLGRSRLHVFLTPGYRREVLKFSFFLHRHARQANLY